jgi:nonsense-mediated mRNA decay protein 3
MSFCVECGATVKTIQGLCPNCFLKRHELIEPPATMDVVKCVQCSKLQVGKAWVETDIEGAILRLLEKNVRIAREVTFRTFTFDVRQEDERNLMVTVKAVLRVDDLDLVKDFRTRFRVHGGACPTCGRKAGFYYEAILQIRADERRLSDEEIEEAVGFTERFVERAASKGEAFISKMEPVKGGVDIYLSSHSLGRNIAKGIRAKYGGTVGVSPKLFGLKDGKEIYRTTHLVRLPRYREGDVVRLEGRMFEVVSVGHRPVLRDLKSGERMSPTETKMERARVVESERFDAEVISISDKEVEYFDPAEARNAKVPRPPNLGAPEKVEIVRAGDESFVSMLRREGAPRRR